MDLTQLKYFCAIVEEGQLTRAARRLCIAQPALSASLARLERELDAPLFDRVGRNIYLNECGQTFYATVSPALSLVENAVHAVSDFKRQQDETLLIGTISRNYLQDAILQFKRANPELRLSQFTIEPENMERELNRNDFDFLFMCEYLNRDDFVQVKLFEDHFCLAVNAGHPLAARDSVRLSELERESFLNLPKGYSFRSFTEGACLAAGFEPQVTTECFHCQMLDLLLAGAGIALVPASFQKKCVNNQAVKFLSLEGEPLVRPMLVSYKKDRHMTRTAHAFLDFLKDHCGGEAARENAPQ